MSFEISIDTKLLDEQDGHITTENTLRCPEEFFNEQPDDSIVKTQDNWQIGPRRIPAEILECGTKFCDSSEIVNNKQVISQSCQPKLGVNSENNCNDQGKVVQPESDVGSTAGVSYIRTPGWIELNGDLAKTNEGLIYDRILIELLKIQSKKQLNNNDLFLRVKTILLNAKRKKADLTLISVFTGFRAIADITGDWSRSNKEIKAVGASLSKYDLGCRNIVETELLYNQIFNYVLKNKFGKAQISLQNALQCIQSESPSPWTSRVYYMKAQMYDIAAHLHLFARKNTQSQAIYFFQRAIEHCQVGPQKNNKYTVYFPLYYQIYIIYIKLDMPTTDTIIVFSNSSIIIQHGSKCDITESQISEAEKMLQTIKQRLGILDTDSQHDISERIQLGEIYLKIRKAQRSLQCREFSAAKTYQLEAMETQKKWSHSCEHRPVSLFQRFPIINENLLTLLNEMENKLLFHKSDHSFTSESNSLESDVM